MEDCIKAVKKAFAMFSQGKIEVPLRTCIMEKNGGAYLTMPSYSEDLGFCVKNCNNFTQNREKGLPTLPTQILLSDKDTGIIVALLDGLHVTKLRTGASSGAAFDMLAKKKCRVGALIGTGAQAATQLEAMISVRELEEVRIFDLDKVSLERFVKEMSEKLEKYGTKFVAADSAQNAVEDADLLITITPSKKPVFDGKQLKPGCTVSCVGSFRPDMQECSPDALVRAKKIYFDSKEAVLSEAGDILVPLQEGLITEDKFSGDIGDVILGNVVGREDDEEIIVYETVGIGAQDLVTSKAIYDKAVEMHIGTEWE